MTLTWTRDGLTYTVTPPPGVEVKAKTGKWDAARAAKNPRDSKGRFIETGAEVRVLNVGLGTVLGQGGPGKTRVQLYKNGKPADDGETREVDNDYLTVTKRPDGSAPTDKPGAAKPGEAKPEAAKPKAPQAAKPDAVAKPEAAAPLDTPEAIRAHWSTGADAAPDLSDQQREFLRSAGTNAADVRLSDGKQLVLLQVREGGPWKVVNHHGQNIGPEQPDQETARAVANALETGLVDADGTPLDFNSPDFAARAKAFKTAESETLGRAAQRILKEVEEGPVKPLRTEPWTAEEVATLAERLGLKVSYIGNSKQDFNVVSPRDRDWKGFSWYSSASSGARAATSNGIGLKPEEVEPYLELYAASPNDDVNHLYWKLGDRLKKARTRLDRDQRLRGGGEDKPKPDDKPSPKPGDAASGGAAELPSLDSPAKIMAYWESGGEGDSRLSDDERRMLRHAALRNVEIRLSDDGGLVLARQNKSGPWRVLNLYGQPTASGEVASLTRARDLARRFERDMVNADGVPLDWNDRDTDKRLSFRTDRGEAYEVALERIQREHRTAMDASGAKRGQQGVTKYGDAAAVRAYWAKGGREEPNEGVDPRKWEEHRRNLEWQAETVEDLKVSPGGQFMLSRVRKGLPWQVTNVEGQTLRSAFTSEKQARDFAARLETEVVDADGNALDWNAPDFAARMKAFRTRGGETAAQAVARITKGDPEPDRVSPPDDSDRGDEAGGAPQRFETVDQARAHLRSLADQTKDPDQTKTLRQYAEAPMLMGTSGQLAIVQTGRGAWTPIVVSSGLRATYFPAPNRKEAPEYLARFEALRDADGNPIPWHDKDAVKTWKSHRGASYADEMVEIQREQDVAHGRVSTREPLDKILAERAAEKERKRQEADKTASDDAWLTEQEQAVAAEDGVERKPYADVSVGDEVVAYRRISVERGMNNHSRMDPLGRRQPIMSNRVPEELKTGDVIEIRGTVLATYGTQLSLRDATYRTSDGRTGKLGYANLADLDGGEQLLVRAAPEEERLPDVRKADAATIADAVTTKLGDADAGRAVRDLDDALGDKDRPSADVTQAWINADRALAALTDRLDANPSDKAGTEADWVERARDTLRRQTRGAGHDTPDFDAQDRRAKYAAMPDAELRDIAARGGLKAEEWEALEPELARRGFDGDGNPLPGSKADLLNPAQPSPDLVGRTVVYNERGGREVGVLRQNGDGRYVLDQRDGARRHELALTEGAWVDVPSPGDPRLANLDPQEYDTAALDGELNRLAPEVQALWKADRRRGDAEFDRAWARYNALLAERQGRPDPEPEPAGQDEALFDTSGGVADEALPALKPVKASGLAVGDRLADGVEILGVDRVAGKVFVTTRDDDDRRRVRVFEPGADVERTAAGGGTAPEPVTVEDAPAGQLAEGDRVLVERPDGVTLPATVTGVTSDGDTRALDVVYGDGSAQTVLVDKGETLPRLGGPEAAVDDGPEPEPVDEPPVEAGPVDAGTLTAGDRIVFPSGDTYEVLTAEPSPSGRDAYVRVRRERDGAELDMAFGKTQKVHRLAPAPGGGEEPAPEPVSTVPDPLPEGTVAARPVLYTYQRRNLNWLGLDASEDPAVRQAAMRVRDRMPLSAEQAAALATAVRARADAPETRPVQQRSLGRLAHALDASAAEARGVPKPRKPEGRDTPFKAYAKNLVEGDMVALPVPRGRAKVGKVTGMRKLMGGRLVEVDVEYGDGRTETRLLTAKTDTYVLPDLPDDVPVPPPGPKIEHIMPGQVREGDVLRRPNGELDGELMRVSKVWPLSDVSVTVRWEPVEKDPRIQYDTSFEQHLLSPDSGPSVVRVERGEASADQPWGITLDDDPNPVDISSAEVNPGDRISVVRTGAKRPVVGTVTGASDLLDSAGVGAGKLITIRKDDGTVTRVMLPDTSPAERITRLKAADANVVARLRQEQIERERKRVTTTISRTMSETAEQAYWLVASYGQQGAGTSEFHALQEIDGVDLNPNRYGVDPVKSIIDALKVVDPAVQAKMRERLAPIISELREQVREQVKESLRQAKALPDESQGAARYRVLQQYKDKPPTDTDTWWSPASTLAALSESLKGSDTTAERTLAHVPEVGHIGNLSTRMDAYRDALGDGANFGKARMRRSVMAETTLADLDAGKVPAVEQVEVGVADKAADGGPGESAMLHHDIVKAAGRDLDTDLARRMSEVGADEWQREVDSLKAEQNAPENTASAIRERLSRERGYADWATLERAAGSGGQREFTDYQQVWKEATRQRVDRREHIDDLTKRISDERRRAVLALLADIRPDGVGGVQMDWHDKSRTSGYKQLTDRSELVKAMRFAERSYPTGWLELFRAHGTKNGQKWKVGKIARGHYQDDTKIINLSDGRAQTTEGGKLGDVAVHEMGHGMEKAVPGLLAAQRVFLWSRTSTGPIGSRQREQKTQIYAGKDEYGFKDDFPEHYTGKEYGAEGQQVHFEVFTTGIESLVAGSPYLDDDFRQWMLGVLALLGTPDKKG